MAKIFEEVELFDPISLEEMDKVKLMNRTDTKYWFHIKELHRLLEMVKADYFILNMHNEVALPYETVYYDTDVNSMFIAHHNGKLNRYKIRRRSYVSSGISFLEVKFKSNKGRTIKKRISSDFEERRFNEAEDTFIHGITPFTVESLRPSLINNFSRITLVNRNFKERCTIDFNLTFKSDNHQVALNNLVIVEIKADGCSSESSLARALRDQRIKSSGFSKYCIGRTVTDYSLKRNAFKDKVRKIEKTINTTGLYNN
ncbi:polyphosphate polymerase domain-containing protein [Geofilum sp. OHC36d9]|uniref:polyphosphate polymerase domain-containing protein n=1 Tax=Geofilum sp. OHC36d9 TaxID=3458413 RepID=UPI004034734D